MGSDADRDRKAILARGELFQTLNDRELEALVEVSRIKRLRAREELCHKGDPGSQIYLILKGVLKAMTTSAEGDDIVFSIMGPGEVCGELALLGGGMRSATMVAHEESELLVLDRRDFLPFLKKHPDAAIKLLEVLAKRLQRISALVEDTHFLNLPSRLAKKLLYLSKSYGVANAKGTRIDLRLSQTELGDLVATTRESINKQMRAWSEEGVVSMDRGYVTIHELGALESLAGFTSD